VVMDSELPLRVAHDISNSLQEKLESLPSVERAYVHVDYESTHAPVSWKRHIVSCDKFDRSFCRSIARSINRHAL